MTKLSESNKGWKKLFVKITDPIGFKVDLKWRIARASRNQAPGITPVEQKDFDLL